MVSGLRVFYCIITVATNPFCVVRLTRYVAAVEASGDGHCSGGEHGGAMLNEVGVVFVRPPSVS